MNYVEAVLIAQARRSGRAQRSALLRHRHIVPRPLGLVLWQLGAEPFTAAAVTWGFGPKHTRMVVPGEPRDRELAFRALTEVAYDFNAWFEAGGADAPQVVVPNRGNLTLLGRLGRRLAYVPTEGKQPADPELVRFGRHLRFLADRSKTPGQQVILVLTDLLANHWVSELSQIEMQHLPAIDATIEPSGGTAYDAACDAERIEIGPAPSGEDDERVDPLVAEFNAKRARRTDEAVVAPLRRAIARHYETLTSRGWPLLWKCLERERRYREAAHVARRWSEDIEAINRHIEWVVVKGLPYRTRHTHAQAARTLRSWEEAQRLVIAEEALDDPLRMAPYFLSNEAISGTVVSVDTDHRVRGKKNMVGRPLVALAIDQRCSIPSGKQLYWTKAPEGREYEVVEIKRDRRRLLVILEHQTGAPVPRPRVGERAVFSIHHLGGSPPLMLPRSAPWTHQGSLSRFDTIEEPRDLRGWE